MKFLKIIFFYLILNILFTKFAFADDDFYINSKTSYYLNENLKNKVNYEITIKNNTTEKYLSNFELVLKGISPENITYTDSKGSKIIKENYDNEKIIIPISFDEAVVGKNNERKFSISFLEDSLVKKNGDIYEVIIPEFDLSNFDNFQTEIIVPKSFGALSYITPNYSKVLENKDYVSYFFDKNEVDKNEIKAAFGEFQVYKLTLNYHLENPVRVESKMEIAIPSQTSFQNIFIESIDPKPFNVIKDFDGNWIAEYYLKPREKVDIKVNLYAQVFSESQPEKLSDEQLNAYISSNDYWETNNEKIKNLANELKTIDNIYRYVVDTLNYDINSAKPETKRKGAFLSLQNPNTSICTEFTDLFVALSRAAGIPAREVNGFAYQEFPQNQPLSLVNDILHSWPQYWDFNNKKWINVDPTWEDTTGGLDYFNKFDLRHIAFVVHGKSSTLPLPAGSYKLSTNPQKDVYVNLSSLPDDKNPKAKIIFNKNTIKIENIGKSVLLQQKLFIYFDNKKHKEIDVPEILPFGFLEINENFPTKVFDKNRPNEIRIEYSGENININLDQNISNLAKIISIFLAIFAIFILLVLVR